MMQTRVFTLPDEPAQLTLGKTIAYACHHKGCVIFLQGDLGAGKTTLARGFLRGLGYEGKVKSPTYTLIETYSLDACQIIHADLYRLDNSAEILTLGLIDMLTDKTHCLIEWPEKATELLPLPDLTCYIAFLPAGREITITAGTPKGEDILTAMEQVPHS